MKMRIEFSMDNDSFQDAMQRVMELRGIMEDIVLDFDHGHEDGGIRDMNGNRIGQWEITENEKD